MATDSKNSFAIDPEKVNGDMGSISVARSTRQELVHIAAERISAGAEIKNVSREIRDALREAFEAKGTPQTSSGRLTWANNKNAGLRVDAADLTAAAQAIAIEAADQVSTNIGTTSQ